MSNPAWLEVMPAIPLARGVPVRCTRISDSAVVVAAGPEGVVLADRHAVDQYEGTGHWWRVDIDDPQGFGYALRTQWGGLNHQLRHHWLHHHFRGIINDADRLALAKACAEVSR